MSFGRHRGSSDIVAVSAAMMKQVERRSYQGNCFAKCGTPPERSHLKSVRPRPPRPTSVSRLNLQSPVIAPGFVFSNNCKPAIDLGISLPFTVVESTRR
jgi:hypothetical protein